MCMVADQGVVVLQGASKIFVAELFGTLDAILALEALDLGVAAISQQHVNDLNVVGSQRQMHWCVHVLVLSVNAGTGQDQSGHDLAMTILSSSVQRSESEWTGLVDVSAVLDQLVDGLKATHGRGVQQGCVTIGVQLVGIVSFTDPRGNRDLITGLGLLGQSSLGLGMEAEQVASKRLSWI